MNMKIIVGLYLLLSTLSYSDKDESYYKKKLEFDGIKSSKLEDREVNLFDVYDPLEPLNRRVYYLNYKLDKYLISPLTDVYKFVTPNVVEKGVTNFFLNLEEVSTFINSGLQFKWGDMVVTGGRFVINSSFGILGIMDLSTKIGLSRRNEDFGQTLGFYGIGSGPFLILPVFGPSNFRDLSGILFDRGTTLYLDPLEMLEFSQNDPEILAVEGLDTNSNLSFSYYETGTSFEYEYIRLFYTKSREIEIEN